MARNDEIPWPEVRPRWIAFVECRVVYVARGVHVMKPAGSFCWTFRVFNGSCVLKSLTERTNLVTALHHKTTETWRPRDILGGGEDCFGIGKGLLKD